MTTRLFTYALFALALLTAPPAFGASDLARAVHEELNLARTNPHGYAGYLQQFRQRFRGKNYRLDRRTQVGTREGVKAVDEAIKFLSRARPLPPMSWSSGLSQAASDLVQEQGESGATGHNAKSGSMKERIERHGRWSGKIGENIGYGPADARQMVMQLIIDDGVPDRGHRQNIFDRSFSAIGVACGGHPVFNSMCAMDFAGSYRD